MGWILLRGLGLWEGRVSIVLLSAKKNQEKAASSHLLIMMGEYIGPKPFRSCSLKQFQNYVKSGRLKPRHQGHGNLQVPCYHYFENELKLSLNK